VKTLAVALMTSLVAMGGCASVPVPSPSPARSPDQTSPTPVPTPLESLPTPALEPLAHLVVEGLGFDYPSEWQAGHYEINSRIQAVVAFVGTAGSEISCQQDPMSGGCVWDWHIEPGTVSVEVIRAVGGPRGRPFEMEPPPGFTAVTVGGLPALAGPAQLNILADLALSWTVSMPLSPWDTYGIVALAREPGIEAMERQIDALIASVRFEPPVPALPTGQARDAAVATALDSLVANDPSFDCFPRMIKASQDAVIRAIPHYAPMRKDLPATCSTNVEETPLGLWRLILTIAWDSARDRRAGSITTLVWVDGLGGLHGSESGPHDDPPYWP
jgi:hypothetical protein